MSCIKFHILFSPFTFYFDVYHFDSNRDTDSNVVRTTGPEVRLPGLNSSAAIPSVWWEAPYFLCAFVSLSVRCRFLWSLLCCWSRNWVKPVKYAQQCLTQKELSTGCSFLLLLIKDASGCPSLRQSCWIVCFYHWYRFSRIPLVSSNKHYQHYCVGWGVDLKSLINRFSAFWLRSSEIIDHRTEICPVIPL